MTPDGPSPSADARERWLQRTGAHALLRSLRVGGDSVVVALTVRPGTPTNALTGITLRFHSDTESSVVVPLPIYPLYHRQWSLDLATSLPASRFAGAASWRAEVELVDRSGRRQLLPVQGAAEDAFRLGGTPDLAALVSQWEFTPPRPAVLTES